MLTGPKSYLTHFTVDTVNTGAVSWTHSSKKTLELLIQTTVVLSTYRARLIKMYSSKYCRIYLIMLYTFSSCCLHVLLSVLKL